MVSYVENLTIVTMNRNKKKYKWCNSCNDANGVWGYHHKVDHMEWKEKNSKNKSVNFCDPDTHAVIYCSYFMATSEIYVKE